MVCYPRDTQFVMFISLSIFYHFEHQAYRHIAVDPSLFSYGTLHVLDKPFNTNIYFTSHIMQFIFLDFSFFKCFCIFLIFSYLQQTLFGFSRFSPPKVYICLSLPLNLCIKLMRKFTIYQGKDTLCTK